MRHYVIGAGTSQLWWHCKLKLWIPAVEFSVQHDHDSNNGNNDNDNDDDIMMMTMTTIMMNNSDVIIIDIDINIIGDFAIQFVLLITYQCNPTAVTFAIWLPSLVLRQCFS